MSEPHVEPAKHSRIRAILAGVVGVIAVIGLLASVLAIWARWVVFNDDAVTKAAQQAVARPEVTDALALRLTDEVFKVVDAQSLVDSILPPALQPLAPAIVGGLRGRVDDALQNLLATDTAQELMVGAVDRAHNALVQLLKGDGLADGVTVQDGEVTLNLLPLIGRGLGALQELGLFSNVSLPDLSRDGDPTQQIAALEQAFGRDLPEGLGQIVVYQSDRLAEAQQTVQRAQDVVVLAQRATIVFVIVTIAAWIGALLLATRRRRAALIMLLGSAAVMIIARAIVKKIVRDAPTLSSKPGGRATIDTVVSSLTAGLVTTVTLLAIVGLIGAGVLYLMGSGERATALRGTADRAGGSLMGVVNAHRDATAIAAFAAAVIVIAMAGLGIGSIIVATVLAAAGAWALWAPGRVEASG